MKRKGPKTLRGWSAKYRRDMKKLILFHDAVLRGLKQEHGKSVEALRRKLRLMSQKYWPLQHAENDRRQAEEANWSDYDRAVDATTSAEVDLFKASPAYQRYQEIRRARVARDARPQFKREGEPTVTREGGRTIVEIKEVGVQGFTPLSGWTPP